MATTQRAWGKKKLATYPCENDLTDLKKYGDFEKFVGAIEMVTGKSASSLPGKLLMIKGKMDPTELRFLVDGIRQSSK